MALNAIRPLPGLGVDDSPQSLPEKIQMSKRNYKPIAAAVGTVFITTLATATLANASQKPFEATALESGYGLLAAADASRRTQEH